MKNTYNCLQEISIADKTSRYYSLEELEKTGMGSIQQLPFCIKILLEQALRKLDNFKVTEQDIENLANWEKTSTQTAEIPFFPSRIVLQDFTGVPSLEEYLKTFGYSCSVMQTPDSLERIAYELAIDCQEEGIKYIEVRMDPILVSNSIQSNLDVLHSIHRGLEKAKKEYNQNKKEGEPTFHYAMIVCILRSIGKWSEHYRKIFESLPHCSPKQIAKISSLEQIRCALLAREKGMPVVALDLAGAEAGNPCGNFQEAFQIAKEHCLQKIVHAGEADSAQSISDAIKLLGAERIGHGTSLFDTKMLIKIKDKKKFIESLVAFIRRKKIPIEVCLTSNLQTLPKIKKIQNHSYIQMLKNNIYNHLH